MMRFLIAGSGTDVGKTIVAAILTVLLQGDYWKPIQCGEGDTEEMKRLLGSAKHRIHPPAYSFRAPLSPHHASRLEGTLICPKSIEPPKTSRPLIIEAVGGIFVPLTTSLLSIDVFKRWKCQWIVVSRHYLGSINHTLLTLDALRRHRVPLAGIIFNGEPNPDTEEAILTQSKLPLLGRLLPEREINHQVIQTYREQWRHLSGILLPK